MEKTSSSKKVISGKRFIIRGVILLVAVILSLWGFTLQVVEYSLSSDKINSSIKIVFISDLHNCFYGGTDQSGLMEEIDSANPDLVLFGGDIIDKSGGTDKALTLMKLVSEKYICCYSYGNHELLNDNYKDFRENVSQMGVYVLEGNGVPLEINGNSITVYGAMDSVQWGNGKTELQQCIDDVDDTRYNILLAHYPEQIDEYLKGDFDLVLSGHAHGGQWRLPVILPQGLFAPDQGLRPQYTGGLFTYDDTSHIISKGLARPLRMIFIPRIFNHPELTVVEID